MGGVYKSQFVVKKRNHEPLHEIIRFYSSNASRYMLMCLDSRASTCNNIKEEGHDTQH